MTRPAPSSSSRSPTRGETRGTLAIAPDVVIAGKYRLREPLRRGGMGSVWVATHLALDEPVAMKFMLNGTAESPPGAPSSAPAPSSSSAVSRDRFDREAKAVAHIRSANVVQILDYGVDGDIPYIVMELLHGEDLGARLKRMRQLPFDEVAELVVAIARALQRAHDVGLVHRDLKPANVFLARDGDQIVPKVLDFGVAKVVHDHPVDGETVEGTLVGTPSYMSPEQAMGRAELDHRADLWSLGVIVYRALTGVRPFESKTFVELVVQICSQTPIAPTQRVPGLPATIDAFIARALEREPARRFQSAREMAQAFLAIAPSGSSLAARALAAEAAAANEDDGPSQVKVVDGQPQRQHHHDERLTLAAPTAGDLTLADSLPAHAFRSASGLAAQPPPAPPTKRSTPVWPIVGTWAALALLGAFAIGLYVYRTGKRSHERSPAAASVSAGAASAATHSVEDQKTTAVFAAASALSVGQASPTASAPAPSASASASASAAKPRTPHPSAPSKRADCTMPYYWNSEGTKFIKPECL